MDEKLLDIQDDNLSDCCGARTYGENRVCEICKEHCSSEEIPVEEKDEQEFGNDLIGPDHEADA